MNGIKKFENNLFKKGLPLDKKELFIAINSYKEDREKYLSSLISISKKLKFTFNVASFFIPFLVLLAFKENIDFKIIIISIGLYFLIDFIKQSFLIHSNYRCNLLVNKNYPIEKLDIVTEKEMSKNPYYFFAKDNSKHFKYSHFLNIDRPIIRAEYDKIIEETKAKVHS